MRISNLTEKAVKNIKTLAVSDHVLKCGSFEILAADTSKFILWIKDLSLFIKRDKPVSNRTVQSFSLELFDWFFMFLTW